MASERNLEISVSCPQEEMREEREGISGIGTGNIGTARIEKICIRTVYIPVWLKGTICERKPYMMTKLERKT